MNAGTKVSTVAIGLALAGLLTAGFTHAGTPPMGRGHGGHGEPMMHLLSQLNLNDAQKTQVHAILEDEHPKLAPLFEASMKAHHALQQAIHAPNFDESAIRAAAAQAGIVEGDLAVEKGRMASRIRAVLTPDQQKQMDALHEEAARRHGAWGDAPAEDPADPE
jgi:Spy/CpxP family protein refolding chaperone